MPGAYLTAADKRRIVKNNWNMVVEQIETALQQVRGSRRRALLEAMLQAARDRNGVGIIEPARQLCRLTKKVPPGCYYQGGKEFKLPGEDVALPRQNDRWSLGLVHPQIYR